MHWSSGGGITLNAFINSLIGFYPMRAKKRIELGIPLDAFVLISVGELNTNKNNKVIIEAIAKLQNKNIHYCLCGVGDLQDYLQTQADNAGLHDNVHFLGYRSDVKDLLLMADVYVMPSIREGLSRSLMEAMACGLPCIVSRIRGNTDLIGDKGGIVCYDNLDYKNAIMKLSQSPLLRVSMMKHNLERIKYYSLESVTSGLINIYRTEF